MVLGGLSHSIGQTKVMAAMHEFHDDVLTDPAVLPQPVCQLPADFEEVLYISPDALVA